MSLMKTAIWDKKVFTGQWVDGSGVPFQVVEPATGQTLGHVGTATRADIDDACARGAAAQQSWEQTSFEERAAILRRAGQLFEQHAEEIKTWLIREAGSIPPKADLETHVAAAECFEAAALPSHPSGDVLPSADGRLSIS